MYPQTIAIQFSRVGPQVLRSLFVRARGVRMVTLGALLILAVGCGGGGGSGGGEDSPAAIASTPVDLPPGQTTANLEWAPSAGDVAGYYVLESRGGSSFSFAHFAPASEIEISGGPGDRVRIQVIALSRNGTVSAPSPPSVEMRFYAAAEATAIEAATNTTADAPETVAAVAPFEATPDGDSIVAASESVEGESDSTIDSADVSDAIVAIDQALRTRLLRADVRFPFRSQAADAGQWLQNHVDAQVGAGLSLVGTGESDLDAFRELIWADRSGQLFVSDGAALAAASLPVDSAATTSASDPIRAFEEAIRLRATERFVGLADFDGDGLGDWLIEDFATGEVWLVNGETHAAIGIQDPTRLVGHGDFDGDGRSELLWSDADGSLRVARPTTAPAAVIEAGASVGLEAFDLATSRLLTVADLDGDGRDDLLFVDSEGRLQAALSASGLVETAELLFAAPSIWSERSSDGLELLATLDLDGDGQIEIAWHDGTDLEVWDASSAH